MLPPDVSIDGEQLEAFGRFVLIFGCLETEVARALIVLNGTRPDPETSRELLGRKPFGRIWGEVLPLLRERADAAGAVELDTEMHALNKERNRVVHASWLPGGGGDMILFRKIEESYETGHAPPKQRFYPEQVPEWCDRMWRAFKLLQRLVFQATATH